MFQTCELWQSALWFCSSEVIFELTDRHCDILNFQASTRRHRSRSWTTSSSPSSTASSSSTGGSHSRYVCHPLFSSERPVSSESSYTENVQWRKEPLDSSVRGHLRLLQHMASLCFVRFWPVGGLVWIVLYSTPLIEACRLQCLTYPILSLICRA